MRLSELLDRPIAYHRAFVPFSGVAGAVLLSQAIFWSKRTSDKEGWFWKTIEEWEEETGLTRREQETARRRLAKILRTELRGIPARLFFMVDFAELEKALYHNDICRSNDELSFDDHSLAESAKLGCTNPPNLDGGKRQAGLALSAKLIHRTPETTTETTHTRTGFPGPEKTAPSGAVCVEKGDIEERAENRDPDPGTDPEEIARLAEAAGLSLSMVKKLSRNYGEEKLREAITYAMSIGARSVPGVVIHALKEGWNLNLKSAPVTRRSSLPESLRKPVSDDEPIKNTSIWKGTETPEEYAARIDQLEKETEERRRNKLVDEPRRAIGGGET
jgi:hypothetical protein